MSRFGPAECPMRVAPSDGAPTPLSRLLPVGKVPEWVRTTREPRRLTLSHPHEHARNVPGRFRADAPASPLRAGLPTPGPQPRSPRTGTP